MRQKEQIIQDICNSHNVLISDVMSRSRFTEIVRVRKAIAKEMYAEGYRINEIARALHRKHGTVFNLLGRRNVNQKVTP